MCSNPSARFTSLHGRSHLNLSKKYQNCTAAEHEHVGESFDTFLKCFRLLWFYTLQNKLILKAQVKLYSSPQALLELQAVMNDPLDKLQFTTFRHDLRHPACVH